ncbi:helix-turn-helix domain-containing protein [Neobacillus vireti]|uniref:helix-turn-helix domain-containing protein n=1 Tax=Neobacillus vireti TaxID=220686 RepID=UPI0030006C04
MKKITIIASTETFENLSTFESIEQLNETVREYKRQFKEILTNTELALLAILHKYSAKFKGVSFLCKNNIGELIGKSRRTVIRVCQRLEALGIIRQYEMKRASDMQQTSNAIVILPLEPVTQEAREDVTPVRQNPSLKQNNYLHNTYPTGAVPLSPYVKFKDFVSYFVNDPKLTNRLYGVYLAQTHYIRDIFNPSDLLDIGLQAIKTAFQATKRKKVRNIAGYYDGVLDRMYDRLHEETIVRHYED